jgi:PAS domain S-box-containing protein
MPETNALETIEQLRQRAETAERNLRLLEAAIRQDYDSILITELSLDDPGPKIVYVNDGFTRITGYSREDVIGKTPRILQGPKTDRAVLDKLKDALRKGHSFFGQTVNYRKDGSEFVNQWDIHPLENEAGEITHWVSYQHDITTKKKSEQSFLDITLDSSDLYENSKKSFVDLDADGIVVQANKLFRDMVGYPKELVTGRPIWDFLVPRQGVALKAQYARVWADDLSKQNSIRLLLQHRNGSLIQAEISVKKVAGPQNKPVVHAEVTNLSVTNIDVTNIDVTNIDVTNIYVTNIAEFVTIDVTTINVTTINVVNIFATYITSYSLTYNILISVYGNGDPVYICPEVCAEGDTGSGGGGGEVFNACNGDIGVPETLTATYSNKTGDCSCLPSTDTIAWDGISMMWEGLYEECNGCGIELRCVDGVWTLGKASCVGVATLVSFTAYPFEVVFDVDNSVGGLTNCTETYRVTITA